MKLGIKGSSSIDLYDMAQVSTPIQRCIMKAWHLDPQTLCLNLTHLYPEFLPNLLAVQKELLVEESLLFAFCKSKSAHSKLNLIPKAVTVDITKYLGTKNTNIQFSEPMEFLEDREY